jgi:hypothetical protein
MGVNYLPMNMPSFTHASAVDQRLIFGPYRSATNQAAAVDEDLPTREKQVVGFLCVKDSGFPSAGAPV